MKENKAEEKEVDFLNRWTFEYNLKEIRPQFIIFYTLQLFKN